MRLIVILRYTKEKGENPSMRKILITGGTVFVSRSLAEYFVGKGDDVYVLNRNNHPQPEGVTLIEADRYQLGEALKKTEFDAVIDVNAYTAEEIRLLLDALPAINDYVFISTSAVYPETFPQPFTETQVVGPNRYWTSYGTNKIAAEQVLFERVPQAYILRPAYIYGPYNNAYREAFVFDCAKEKRPFYLPSDGSQGLQFIHIEDLCRLVEGLISTKPEQKIYNVGNETMISIKDWVTAGYEAVGEEVSFVQVPDTQNQSQYFSFPNYQYELDVAQQTAIIGKTKEIREGLTESWKWYRENEEVVNKRDYLAYIERELNKEIN